MTFHINNTTSFANIFILKLLFEFENFLKIEDEALTKAQTKEKNSKKKNFKKIIKKRINE